MSLSQWSGALQPGTTGLLTLMKLPIELVPVDGNGCVGPPNPLSLCRACPVQLASRYTWACRPISRFAYEVARSLADVCRFTQVPHPEFTWKMIPPDPSRSMNRQKWLDAQSP